MKIINLLFVFFLSLCSMCLYAQSEAENNSVIVLSPQVTGDVLVPMGAFSDIAPIGVGAGFNMSVNNLFFKYSAIKLCAGYDFIYEESDTINSFGILSLTLFGGYRVLEQGIFSITPLVGIGYIGHVVDDSGYNLYFDPHIALQTDFDIALFNNFSLCITPGVLFFFEQNNIGTYFTVNIGVKASYNIYSGESRPEKTIPVPVLPHILIKRNPPVFSPNGDGSKDTVSISLQSDNNVPVARYEVHILGTGQKAVRSFSGNRKLPGKIVWDGSADNGRPAAEGTYTAELTIEYKDGREQKTVSQSFVLDTTPPEISLKLTPNVFSPDNDGENDTCTLNSTVKDDSAVTKWEIAIKDSAGNAFKTFSGSGNIPESLIWDGKSDKGILAESAQDYPLVLSVYDEAGNKSVVHKVVRTDILVTKFGNKYKIIISNIHFDAFSSDYRQGTRDHVNENIKIIERLSQILKKFKSYTIVVEGHALNFYGKDNPRAAKEEKNVLLKLSRERAEKIKQALVEKGIKAERIRAVGKGSSEPLVPYDDKKNNWKNRRVGILLEK